MLTTFIIICVVFCLIAMAAVALPLWFGGRKAADAEDRHETILGILRQQAADLEKEREAGRIDLDEYEDALDTVGRIQEITPFDRVMLTEIHSALGQHAKAIEIATGLLSEYPQNYQVRRAYVSSLILGGRDKEAGKYARSCLKDKTADSNAIAAYVLRIAGNYKAAAGYATRAINIDNGHIGAMETLGICLAEKGEYDKARIVAGAINEKSPGDKAALNVLSYCEGH